MLILFDHSTPAPLSSYLTGHTVIEAKDKGWDRLSNGDLLAEAERAGFDLLVTADNSIAYQQNRPEARHCGDQPQPVAAGSADDPEGCRCGQRGDARKLHANRNTGAVNPRRVL
jgi:hypothetical protein